VIRWYKNEAAKWRARGRRNRLHHRPIGSGAGWNHSGRNSELLSALLAEQGSPTTCERQAGTWSGEAEIIAQAGRAGAVTIATNMA